MNDFEELNSQDKNCAIGVHLSTFAGYLIPFGNILGPLIIWLFNKENSPYVDQHGKAALNFQISLLIWFIISFLLCLILIGFVCVLILIVTDIFYTIINSIKASNGEPASYPLSIKFIS